MTDNRTTELLPCPFCSSEPDLLESYGGWYIRCSCGVSMCENYSEGGFPVGEFVTEAEAIAAWNSRAERTCHDDNIGFSFVCSECGANVKNTYVGRSYVDKFGKRWYATSDGQAFNYCPNCGAKVVS